MAERSKRKGNGIAFRHQDHSQNGGRKERRWKKGKEEGEKEGSKKDDEKKTTTDEDPDLEENTPKGIKAESWQILPFIEGLFNSMKSGEQRTQAR